jgi:hypothetical protein
MMNTIHLVVHEIRNHLLLIHLRRTILAHVTKDTIVEADVTHTLRRD